MKGDRIMKRSSRKYYGTLKLLECLKIRRMAAHPESNTGVLKPAIEFSFDALRFTYHYRDSSAFIADPSLTAFLWSLDLDLSDFKFEGHGGDFYTQRFYCEKYDMFMFTNPSRPEMGVHFKLMGNGCRLYFLNHTVESFIRATCRDDVSFSRIDVALDDYTGSFYTPRTLADLDAQGLISTRWGRVDPHFPRKAGGKGQYLEETIYFGSLKNETHLRVYDKYLEEVGRLKKTEEELKADGITSWIRWELTLQAKSANAFVRLLFNGDFNLPRTAIGVLCSKFRIVKPDHTRLTRCSSDPLWLDFVGCDNVIQISRQRPESDLASSLNWFYKCIMPTYVGLSEALPEVMMQLYTGVFRSGHYRKFKVPA